MLGGWLSTNQLECIAAKIDYNALCTRSIIATTDCIAKKLI